MTRKPHDPDEMVAVVDGDDRIAGKATRKEVHDKGLMHREVYVYLINAQGQVLLQKRADNHKWDHSAGGHFPYNHSYDEAAVREAYEELGIRITREELVEIASETIEKKVEEGMNRRKVKVFVVRKELQIEDFRIDKGEIEEVRYFGRKELEELMKEEGKMTSSARQLIEKYIMKELHRFKYFLCITDL